MTEIAPKPRRVHPNRIAFSGVLAIVDTPSDKPPAGSRGNRVVLTREAAEDALWSLEGMPVDFKEGWDGHGLQKCGVIEEGHLEGNNLVVSGYLFAKDFASLVRDIRRAGKQLGMSYELDKAHVEDMSARIWRLTKVTFTGAAFLYADKAAYASTRFNIEACGDQEFTGRISFVDFEEITGSIRTLAGNEV